MDAPFAALDDHRESRKVAPARSPDDLDSTNAARENWDRYRYGVDRGHRRYTRLAARLDGFYLGGERDSDGNVESGGQWSEEALHLLAEQGRPAYEFNEIMPAINAAIGYQVANRMDVAFRPRGGDATKELAEIRSKIAMQIADNNKFRWHETQVFSDGMIQQRGYFEFRLSFDDTILGELYVGSLDPMDVIPDPDAKSYDPKDWGDVIVTRWMTIDEIGRFYGESARKVVEDSYDAGDDWGEGYDDDGAERNKFGSTYWHHYDATSAGGGIRRYRIVDRQQWVRRYGDVAIHPSGDVRTLEGDETPDALDEMRARGVMIAKRMVRRVRWTVSTCGTLLHDDWSPYDRFTIVPFFPYFRRGKTRGMVDNAIDPQQALNKAVSQYIHIINSTANSGWIVEEDSLANMSAEDLEEHGASTGLVLEVKAGAQRPQKIQPNQVPPGVDRIIDRAGQTLKEVTVPDAMRGTQGPERSGIAIQSKQHAAQQGLAVPLDNLARTRAMCAEWIDYAISKYYDSHRVFRITQTDPFGQEQTEEIEINKPAGAGQYLNDMTAGEYDLVVSEQPMQVTFENSQFEQAIELRKQGVNVPDSVVIRHSNLSDKHEILQQMEAQQKPLEDPLAQAEAALREARAEKERALARKHDAEAVSSGIEGMYSATQAAGTITTNPAIAPLADGLLKSAGFVDRNAAPIVPGVPKNTAPSAMTDAPQNTSPMFPPRANPGEPDGSALLPTVHARPAPSGGGAMAGIETQRIEPV